MPWKRSSAYFGMKWDAWSVLYLLVVSVLIVLVAESVRSCLITIVSLLFVVLSCWLLCPVCPHAARPLNRRKPINNLMFFMDIFYCVDNNMYKSNGVILQRYVPASRFQHSRHLLHCVHGFPLRYCPLLRLVRKSRHAPLVYLNR